MWRDLPIDLLANIFSFLSADSLACAASACRQWHNCAKTHPLASNSSFSWFMALPIRHHHHSNNNNNNNNLSCYAKNPTNKNWHLVSLDFLPCPIRPLTSMGGHVLLGTIKPTNLHLLVCNPFTREFKKLPMLNTPRSNPAIGVISLEHDRTRAEASFPRFQVYVAGGLSEGSTFEPTFEVYDSRHDAWRTVGMLPTEFAVRLTVWTPNDSVCCDGVLYWITSARAYSLMGCDISSNSWKELRVPMAEKLEFAALVLRNGKLTVVGGMCGGEASVWELGKGDMWELIEKVPVELGVKFVGEKESWVSTKCVGCDGAVYLYRDLGSGMIAWKEVGESGKWEWSWVEGCSSVKGKKVPNLQIKGVVIPPNLAQSCFFSSK